MILKYHSIKINGCEIKMDFINKENNNENKNFEHDNEHKYSNIKVESISNSSKDNSSKDKSNSDNKGFIIRMPILLHKELKTVSLLIGVNMNSFVIDSIKEKLDRLKDKDEKIRIMTDFTKSKAQHNNAQHKNAQHNNL